MFVVRRQIESYQCKTIHSYDTIRLLCCVYSAKDDTIKIWKSSNDAGELSVSSTLEFKSQDTDIPLPDGPVPSEYVSTVTDTPIRPKIASSLYQLPSLTIAELSTVSTDHCGTTRKLELSLNFKLAQRRLYGMQVTWF